jgi:hypothetical protein
MLIVALVIALGVVWLAMREANKKKNPPSKDEANK